MLVREIGIASPGCQILLTARWAYVQVEITRRLLRCLLLIRLQWHLDVLKRRCFIELSVLHLMTTKGYTVTRERWNFFRFNCSSEIETRDVSCSLSSLLLFFYRGVVILLKWISIFLNRNKRRRTISFDLWRMPLDVWTDLIDERYGSSDKMVVVVLLDMRTFCRPMTIFRNTLCRWKPFSMVRTFCFRENGRERAYGNIC